LIVSPGLTVLCTSDTTTYEAVLKSWKEFEKPDNVNEILGTFGRNVDTSNGDDWPRHRKIVAPCFSERASGKVWEEALSRTEGLVDKWLEDKSANAVEGMSTLALNVISAVAFENHQVNEVAKGHAMSLKEALTTVMSTSISPVLEGILPRLSWLHILMPTNIKTLMLAMQEFRQYMDDLISRERQRSSTEPEEPAKSEMNLIQTLIKANTGSSAKLSSTELLGNIFIFTVGGLESTSATLTYALSLLSIHPLIQDWVYEEIQEATQDIDISYLEIFPKLLRTKAVMVLSLHYLTFLFYYLTKIIVRNSPAILPLPTPPPNISQPVGILHTTNIIVIWGYNPSCANANHAEFLGVSRLQ
jgi:cytochrome P450